MEEKKKDTNCEQEQKKISKRYLAFYIIGLFSVALVLILLSYITQLRADRQLASMNSALEQKDTTVQGVQAKVTALQDTVTKQEEKLKQTNDTLEELRTALKASEEDELTAILQQRLDERDAYYQMTLLENAAAVGDTHTAQNCIQHLETTYAGRLDGSTEHAVLTGSLATRYAELKKRFA